MKWTMCTQLRAWWIQRCGYSIKKIPSVPIKTHMPAESASRPTMWNFWSKWLNAAGRFLESPEWGRVCFWDAGKWASSLHICKMCCYFPQSSDGVPSNCGKTKSIYWL